ncbi:hypothetical protein D3C81_794710 [compost metagenome]
MLLDLINPVVFMEDPVDYCRSNIESVVLDDQAHVFVGFVELFHPIRLDFVWLTTINFEVMDDNFFFNHIF